MKNWISNILAGIRSIGQSVSTFNILPTTDVETAIKDYKLRAKQRYQTLKVYNYPKPLWKVEQPREWNSDLQQAPRDGSEVLLLVEVKTNIFRMFVASFDVAHNAWSTIGYLGHRNFISSKKIKSWYNIELKTPKQKES